MSMLQVGMRSLAVKAANGDIRSYKLMTDLIRLAEVAKVELEEDEQINITINFTD
jgi:hypothetical protein